MIKISRYVILMAALAMFLVAAPAQALLIDDFTDSSADIVSPGPGSTFGSTTDGAPFGSIVGGVRETSLTNSSGGGPVDLFTKVGTGIPDSVMAYAAAPGVKGDFGLLYNAGGPGLGGVDLTDGGTSNAFDIAVNFSDFPSDIYIEVVDTTSAFFFAGPFPLPGLVPGGAPVSVPVPFAAFPGVDFSSVDGLFFGVDAPIAADLELLFLDTTFIVPEPSTMVCLSMGGAVLLVRRKR